MVAMAWLASRTWAKIRIPGAGWRWQSQPRFPRVVQIDFRWRAVRPDL